MQADYGKFFLKLPRKTTQRGKTGFIKAAPSAATLPRVHSGPGLPSIRR